MPSIHDHAQSLRRLRCLVALLLPWPLAAHSADARRILSVGPQTYGFLTLASGHTFKFLGTGPIAGKDLQHLGMGVNYATEAATFDAIDAEAAELFEHFRYLAEASKEDAVAIVAHLAFEPGIGSRGTYNTVYRRDASGTWSALSSDPNRTFPVVAPPSSRWEYRHDVTAEREALASARAWLRLLDGRLDAEAWETAAPLLKGILSRGKWLAALSEPRKDLGKLSSRSLVSTLSTPFVAGAPEGSYVVFEFNSASSRKIAVRERVVEMLCEDRRWRVAGYTRSD